MFKNNLTHRLLRSFVDHLQVNKKSVAIQRFLNTSVLNDKIVVIEEDNGTKLKFPTVWLRDNCICPECYHSGTNGRILNWRQCKNAIKINEIKANGKESVHIEWIDKHISTFHLNWLKDRDFSVENRKRYLNEQYRPKPKLWGKKDFENVYKTFKFDEVLNDDNALLSWLQTMAVEGFAIIQNAPNDTKVVHYLANRIGFPKKTTYGETFEVKSKDGAHNYAYLMTSLPLHTDMPYYEYKAGINILHCLEQSKSDGGANLLTDGFYIAEKMRQEYPKEFQILNTIPVDWYDIGKDGDMSFHSLWRQPMINLDSDGQYLRINENVNKRDSHFTVPFEQVERWYEAYNLFNELSNEEAVTFKVQSNEVFVFNNLRMLHGRTAYVDSFLL